VPIDYIENWNDQCPGQESLPYDVDGDGCIDDSDNDGFNDLLDICPGYNDSIDQDLDTIPDGCDLIIDNDNDGISNNEDLCDGFNDTIDIDNDSIPDACDSLIDRDGDDVDDEFDWFPDDPTEAYDSDLDGVGDASDQCEGFDDRIDVDNDLIPDSCDETIGFEEEQTNDGQNLSANLEHNIPAISLITLVIIVLFARKKYSG
jgi:hypothetical protein